MRSLFFATLLALETLPLGLPAAYAQTESQDCAVTVMEVRNDLERGRDLQVVLAQSQEITVQDYPAGRPLSYQFIIEGSATRDVMASPQFLQALSTRIINSCASAGTVAFGVYRTGWSEQYVYMGEGLVERSRCVTPDRNQPNRRLAWGYHFCV